MEILPLLHSAGNFSSSNLLFPDVNVLSSLPFDNVPVESNILRGLEHFTVLEHSQYVLLAAEAKKKNVSCDRIKTDGRQRLSNAVTGVYGQA